MPAFSVIIPTRNRDEYIAEAVRSVLEQSFTDTEILIVNDGSHAVPKFSDPRVSVLDNHERGPVPARNLGVERARGRFIAFLDDDDAWIDRDFLNHSAALLHSSAALTFGDGIMQFPGEDRPRQFARDADVKSLETDNTILISAVCYHRDLHQSLGRFDECLPYYWDWDWTLRVARAGHSIVRIAHPVVDIRIHESNMSGESYAALRTENLGKFARKHELGALKLKNHASFAA